MKTKAGERNNATHLLQEGDGGPQLGVHWETVTAVSLIEAGADVVVLRHPDSLTRVKESIDELMTAESV